jgi:RNA-directed DNA polymerase
LQPLKKGIYNASRLGKNIDYDFVVAVYQVRRYLYGGLSNASLLDYLRGAKPNLQFRGLMSYYPLVNDSEQLSMIDGWILHTFEQALRLRERLWLLKSGASLPGPYPAWISKLQMLKDHSAGGITCDLRIPSVSLINKAIALAIERKGIRGVASLWPAYY